MSLTFLKFTFRSHLMALFIFLVYIQSKGYCHVGSPLAPFSQRHRRLVISVDIYPLHIVQEQVCALMKKTL